MMRKRFFAILTVVALLISMAPAMAFASGETVLPAEMSGTWGGGEKTVYYNGNYYDTLQKAMQAVYESEPSGTAEVYCKPGANVGSMSHAHVADSVTVYGNGAAINPGGDQDFEVDMFKFKRDDGAHQNSTGAALEEDITITVDNLGGIAVWGSRTTDYTINIVLRNCKNVHKVFVMGTTGVTNVTITDSSFVAANGSNRNTGIFTNSGGEITVENTSFEGIAVPINQNNKAPGSTQVISVTGCTFTDCATPDLVAAESAASYGAPIRAVNSAGEKVELIVDGCKFDYSGDVSANGDILLGSGQEDLGVDVEITNTNADVKVHEPGGITAEAVTVTDSEKLYTTDAWELKVEANNDPGETPNPPAGGDDPIPGGSTGTPDPDDPDNDNGTPEEPAKPSTPDDNEQDGTPDTGDSSNMAMPLAAAGLAMAALAVMELRRRKA